MILTPHILVGAAIGTKIHNLGLIILLGIVIHFILDKIPHWDYLNHGIRDFKKTKDFNAFFSDLLKIAVDGLIGLLIVLLIVWQMDLLSFNHLFFILLGIFFSILPDIILGFLLLFAPKALLEKYMNFHYKFLHVARVKEKEGKITFLGLTSQIIIIIISCVVLLSL